MPLGQRVPPGSSELPLKKPEPITFQAVEPLYSFADIVLNDTTYDSIQNVLAIFSKRDLIFNRWGLGSVYKQQNQAGINLYGDSGTGKSMTAHAIAKQLSRKILSVDYSQIESRYVGDTAKNLVTIFEYAKKEKVVIFFDEADALLSKRVTSMSHSTDVSVNQTRSMLLLLISEYDDIIIFATNFVTNYDPAFMRRILGHIKFELPDMDNRVKLWKKYIPDQLPIDINKDTLANSMAEKFDNVSGSDISTAILQSALKAARKNEPFVRQSYFKEAICNILSSKTDNSGSNDGTVISKRVVSEEYVKQQLGGSLK